MRKIRDIARFFTLSLVCASVASGRVVLRRDRPRRVLLLYFRRASVLVLCLLLLCLLLLDDDDDDECARKEIQRIGIRGGFLKALGFFAQKCDSATRRIQSTLYSERSRDRRK